jgi:quinol monooxygenase YgiN
LRAITVSSTNEAFRTGYDRAVATTGALRSYRVWRGQDDSNLVVITETFDSREVPEASWTSHATRDAMARDGIDMSSVQIDYLDDVGSGTH